MFLVIRKLTVPERSGIVTRTATARTYWSPIFGHNAQPWTAHDNRAPDDY
ncbi:hypothetical protein ACFWNT_04325 [Streptomyces sp. NPDC058409]